MSVTAEERARATLEDAFTGGRMPEWLVPIFTDAIRQAETDAILENKHVMEELAAKKDWVCKAAQAPAGHAGEDPQDCGWPGCGCDPEADRVITELMEHDLTLISNTELRELRSAADG